MKKNRKVPQRIIPLRDFEFLCNDYSAAFLDFSHFKCKNFSFQVQSNSYYHQRSALTRKKEAADNETKTVTEDM